MEYQIERNRTAQIVALLLTAIIVGGAIAWAITAA